MSCRSIIDGGTHTDFIEVDAATNSGKSEMRKVTEEIEFSSFSGHRKVYLFDEAHQLTKDALDALLKPLEENISGSLDKKLVCIFCTTEPEKMRATILSRCAPAFVIRPLSPEVLGKRLAYVCDQEGIPYDPAMLPLIAEITECHVRDALKAVEGVSMLGTLDRANVTTYLHLDLNDTYLDILLNIGQDLAASVRAAEKVLGRASPLTCYQRLSNVSIMAYKVFLGIEKPAGYWNADRVALLASRGASLLGYTSLFASRPGRPSAAMLLCDLAQLHHSGSPNPLAVQRVVTLVETPQAQVVVPSAPAPIPVQVPVQMGKVNGKPPYQADDSVVVDERAVKHTARQPPASARTLELDVDKFSWLLGLRVAELDEAGHGGSQGRSYVDRH